MIETSDNEWIVENLEEIGNIRFEFTERLAQFADKINVNRALVMYVMFAALARSANIQLEYQKEEAISEINGTDED